MNQLWINAEINNKVSELAPEFNDPSHACVIGMLIFLKNMYLKEKIKNGFESKNNWFKNLIEKLVDIYSFFYNKILLLTIR